MVKINPQKIKKEIHVIEIILIGIIFVLGLIVIFNYQAVKQIVIDNLLSYGFLAIFILVFLFEFLPQVLSPDYVVLASISVGLNIYLIVLYAIMGSIIGSLLGYYIGYRHGFKLVSAMIKKESLDRVLRGWDKHGKWFVLVSATAPLPVPYFPLVFGALRMSLKDFLLWGVLPRALGLIVTGWIGYYGFIQIEKWF